MKKLVFAVARTTFTVVVCLGIVEGIIRWLGVAPPLDKQFSAHVQDPHLPYKPIPNSHMTGRSPTDEFDYDYRHNSFGFRDVEHDLDKGEGVFRILGLGDSFTWGAGALFEETYLYRLEKMLNERPGDHPRVEIIKAGISRYFPEPERILLDQYGRHYSPDLVLIGFLPNDVIETYFGLDELLIDDSGYLVTREAAELGALGVLAYRSSHVCRIILRRYVEFRRSRRFPRHRYGEYGADGFHEKDWQVLESEYSRMAAITREIGSRLVIAAIPQKGPWNKWHGYPPERLAGWAAREGDVGVVDVLPAMIEASKVEPYLYYELDGHCTPAGYGVVADTLYRQLTEGGWVP